MACPGLVAVILTTNGYIYGSAHGEVAENGDGPWISMVDKFALGAA